jgi:hypothetical protein
VPRGWWRGTSKPPDARHALGRDPPSGGLLPIARTVRHFCGGREEGAVVFEFFKRKPAAQLAKPRRSLALVSEMTEQQLIDSIRVTFTNSHVIVAALFLVAYENFKPYFSVFCRSMPGEMREYPATLEGMIEFLADAHAQYAGNSIANEVNSRRFFYLYVSALLRLLHVRAKARSELWDTVAEVWVPLLEGGRALRATLNRTSLWKPNEIDYFADVHNEDEGERYVEELMMPKEVRYHAKVEEWRDRDLTPEQRAAVKEMDKLFDHK